jgi:hypothetical protein
MAAERVKRLKDLVDRLERLPPSPDRDRMLSEVRSRAVDLDTGVTPRAMLPLREPTPPPPAVARPRKVDSGRRLPRRAPLEPVRPIFAATPLLDDRLSLEDAPLPHAWAQDGQAARPWTQGLRA